MWTFIEILLVCIMPPVVMFIVWRGAPPATVAEILHTVDRRPDV
jgi:hypothetical protein